MKNDIQIKCALNLFDLNGYKPRRRLKPRPSPAGKVAAPIVYKATTDEEIIILQVYP